MQLRLSRNNAPPDGTASILVARSLFLLRYLLIVIFNIFALYFLTISVDLIKVVVGKKERK